MSGRFLKCAFAALITLSMLNPGPALAQTRSQPGASTEQAPSTTPRPRRERSEAQKRNDQIMRDCGTEWRANKPALTAQGKNWRTFLRECRGRRSA
ncbi:MAG: hypothetical protein WCH83_14110 [Alphaproteobacteria bacterium]